MCVAPLCAQAERARRENPGHHSIQGILKQEWDAMSDAERQPFEARLAELDKPLIELARPPNVSPRSL